MKNKLRLWQLCGFLFTSIFGTLLHFAYEWSGNSITAAIFSGVNESVWEHMKLLYIPMLVFSFAQASSFSFREDYWLIKLYGSVLGTASIPLLFWSYNGSIGASPALVNIMIFYLSAAAAYCFELWLFEAKRLTATKYLPLAISVSIAVMFVLFTFYPPHIELFRDPTNNSYGI